MSFDEIPSTFSSIDPTLSDDSFGRPSQTSNTLQVKTEPRLNNSEYLNEVEVIEIPVDEPIEIHDTPPESTQDLYDRMMESNDRERNQSVLRSSESHSEEQISSFETSTSN